MVAEVPPDLTVVIHAALAFVLAWAIGYERFYLTNYWTKCAPDSQPAKGVSSVRPGAAYAETAPGASPVRCVRLVVSTIFRPFGAVICSSFKRPPPRDVVIAPQAPLSSFVQLTRVVRARARCRLSPPLAGFTTNLLLTASLPPG